MPAGVTMKMTGGTVEMSGQKGNLSMHLNNQVRLEENDGKIRVITEGENGDSLMGLTRTLVANMVTGVTEGWSKILELSGTGFRATTTGEELVLSLGFSHPVKIPAPKGIRFEVKENKIKVLGLDKSLVGQVTAEIRDWKPADPYKAKGLKYENEIIVKKAGKAAKVGGTPTK
jgi:large subunit ribosomal protein L6